MDFDNDLVQQWWFRILTTIITAQFTFNEYFSQLYIDNI